MKRLVDHLSKHVKFSSDEYLEIINYFQVIKIEKKCEFIQYGDMMSNHFFILDGFVVSYVKGIKDYQHIYGFYTEDTWLNYDFLSPKDSCTLFDYATFEDTTMLTISTTQMKALVERYPKLKDYFYQVILEDCKKKELRILNQLIFNAGEKYQLFAMSFPEIINRMNLYFIASYLSIKPETLSRIRNMNKSKRLE